MLLHLLQYLPHYTEKQNSLGSQVSQFAYLSLKHHKKKTLLDVLTYIIEFKQCKPSVSTDGYFLI